MKGGSQYVLSYLMIFLGFLVFGGLIALAIKYNKNKGILNNNSNTTNQNKNEEKVRAPSENIAS